MEIQNNNIGVRSRIIAIEVEGCLIGCPII